MRKLRHFTSSKLQSLDIHGGFTHWEKMRRTDGERKGKRTSPLPRGTPGPDQPACRGELHCTLRRVRGDPPASAREDGSGPAESVIAATQARYLGPVWRSYPLRRFIHNHLIDPTDVTEAGTPLNLSPDLILQELRTP